jgi:hypothetical protein
VGARPVADGVAADAAADRPVGPLAQATGLVPLGDEAQLLAGDVVEAPRIVRNEVDEVAVMDQP